MLKMGGAHDPDTALVARIGHGDEMAFRAFVSAKMPRLHGLACCMLHDQALAEDVVQEAFLRGSRHAGDWRSGSARFDTWLHRVVLNCARIGCAASPGNVSPPISRTVPIRRLTRRPGSLMPTACCACAPH